MQKRWWISLPGVAVAAGIFCITGCERGREQPIQFSHKKHVQQGVECSDCHRYFSHRANSGRPTVEVCAECHEDGPMTDSPEEKKLIEEFIKPGKEIPWKRVYYVPEHTYFTHFRHVEFAKLECTFCHGDIASQDRPLRKPLRRMTMYFCYNCHEKERVSTDCITCHR